VPHRLRGMPAVVRLRRLMFVCRAKRRASRSRRQSQSEAPDASLDNSDTQANRPTIAMNARDFAWQIDRTIMASRPSIRIARKARSKAESDFATWLMMAKLGSFDDLPPNAQGVLTNYRARLERMSEAESKVVAVREVYAAYYSEMGGAGAAPEPEAPSTSVDDRVVRFQRPPQPAPPAAGASATPAARKSVPALLIFAALVALIAAYRFLAH
jgi:hypothetical protein